MNLEFSQNIFEKNSSIKFDKNLFGDSRVVPCGQTDIYEEAKSRFSQFCE